MRSKVKHLADYSIEHETAKVLYILERDRFYSKLKVSAMLLLLAIAIVSLFAFIGSVDGFVKWICGVQF